MHGQEPGHLEAGLAPLETVFPEEKFPSTKQHFGHGGTRPVTWKLEGAKAHVHDRAPPVVAPCARIDVAIVEPVLLAAVLRDTRVILLQAWVHLPVLVDGGRVVAAVGVEVKHGLELLGHVLGVLGQGEDDVALVEVLGDKRLGVHRCEGGEEGDGVLDEFAVHVVGLDCEAGLKALDVVDGRQGGFLGMGEERSAVG